MPYFCRFIPILTLNFCYCYLNRSFYFSCGQEWNFNYWKMKICINSEIKNIHPPTNYTVLNVSQPFHTVSFDWFLSSLEWILNLEFWSLKLFIFFQKWLWNIRSRLNSSKIWVFESVLRYVPSKLKLFVQKMMILIKYI